MPPSANSTEQQKYTGHLDSLSPQQQEALEKFRHEITTVERQIQNLVVEYERLADVRLPSCSEKNGKLIETSCTVLDLKGVSLRSFSNVFGFVKQASNIGQNYYPERMGKFYIINAP